MCIYFCLFLYVSKYVQTSKTWLRGHIWGPCGLHAYYAFLLLIVALSPHQHADADQVNELPHSHQFSTTADGEHVANTLNRILIAHSKVWNEEHMRLNMSK